MSTNLAAAMKAMKNAGPKKSYEVTITVDERYKVSIEAASEEAAGEQALEAYNEGNTTYEGRNIEVTAIHEN